jgi:hypothetical protein
MKACRVMRRRRLHIFYTVGSQMAVRLSALRASRPLPPARFLVLISVRGWVDPRATMWLGGLGKLKEIHLIGTWTRDLPACSIVPQPTTLPCAPDASVKTVILDLALHLRLLKPLTIFWNLVLFQSSGEQNMKENLLNRAFWWSDSSSTKASISIGFLSYPTCLKMETESISKT